jgi:pilus assembly protein CpaC
MKNPWINQHKRLQVIGRRMLGLTLFVAGSMAVAQQTSTRQAPTAPVAALPSGQSEAAIEPNPNTVHLGVGHSLLIRTQSRVKRILTGNPTAIDAVITSPNELVLTAKQPGSSSLLLWEESGDSRMLDVFADVDVNSLRDAIEQAYPGGRVEALSQEGKVVLTGTVTSTAVADQLVKMATNFAKDVVNGLQIAQPPKQRQVMLKVRFAEADRAKLSAFAVNLFSTGATNTIGTISTQQFGPQSLNNSQGTTATGVSQFNLSDLLNIFLFRPDINLGATIKALQQKNVLQILAEPNLMAISGQPAQFLAGGEFPYPVVQGSATGGYGAVTIQFKPYGVKLEFIGTIDDNDTIRLRVKPEVSSLDYTQTVTISGFVLPAIQTRRAETEIELHNGQSFGIAGLLDERTTIQLSKVPGIGDVPILGEIFKSRNVNRTNSELVVLVTPTIVDPVGTSGAAPAAPVSMPVQNLQPSEFDKGLPYPAKNPGDK